jgi:hypothetical protein
MESEVQLPYSQELTTGPYLEAYEQYFSKIHSNIISHLHLGILSGLFP